MKLYYVPGNACSITPHIIANELGINLQLEKVEMKGSERKYSGGDFRKINPLGYIPALEVESGKILTETQSMIQYLADLNPEKNLIPKYGTWERIICVQWLAFIATEIHKGFSALFYESSPEAKINSMKRLTGRFDHIEKHLNENQFILGTNFSVCDAYLYNLINWMPEVDMNVDQWKNISEYYKKLGLRESIQLAFKLQA
jgi:glutathione S-transferase